MTLGPHVPEWARLHAALSELVSACEASFAAIIDEGNGLWCVAYSLPAALEARLDWASLQRRPADFVDVRLRHRHSDLLFSIRTSDTREEILVYALVEHQSSPDPLMAFRMLRYLVRIWEDHLKAHRRARRLPLIVPFIVYHGAARWNAARTLRELLHGPADLIAAAAEHLPRFRYRLFDLQHSGAEPLRERHLTAGGRVALRAMALQGHDDRVLDAIREMGQMLGEMRAQPDGEAALGALLRYLLATHEKVDRKKFQRAIEDATHPHAGEEVVTVYEQLVEEGRKKGRKQGLLEGIEKGLLKGIEKGRVEGIEKGIVEGQIKTLLTLLAAKFGPLPADVSERVKHAGSSELTTWSTRLLTATTLAETLGEPPARKLASRTAKARR